MAVDQVNSYKQAELVDKKSKEAKYKEYDELLFPRHVILADTYEFHTPQVIYYH